MIAEALRHARQVAAPALAAAMLAAGAVAADEPAGAEAVLGKQVSNLVEALAAARSEVDSLKARLDELKLGAGSAVSLTPVKEKVFSAGQLRILDVSEELRMAVLDAGAAQGMKPGMRFAVTRAGAVVAEVQVVDVREKIAGAAIVKIERGAGFPTTGDMLAEMMTQSR